MQDASRSHWISYVLCAALWPVNVIGVGHAQAILWARTAADASFAGLYVVVALQKYSIPASIVSALVVAGCAIHGGHSRVASRTMFGIAAVGTIMIWVHALSRLN